MSQKQSPVKAVIVGAGHRAMIYASYAKQHPELLRIVGVVDPDPERVREAVREHGVPSEHCFADVEALIGSGLQADAAINGTMDRLHVRTTLPLIKAGFHVLLEKPIGISMDEIRELQQAAQKYGRIVMICHVLRYAPFYAEIKRRLHAGELGTLIDIQLAEHVSYHHMATAFVRGKWGSEAVCGSPMLLAKCCHDLDILAWLAGGTRPKHVSSVGGRHYFREGNAPEGAGTRCLKDCTIESTCPYSAKSLYVDRDRWSFYVWGERSMSHEEKLQSLAEDHPYGRCVWCCDNDVVDRQAVMVEFASGLTATHHMVGGSARSSRTVHILGTEGEIQGTLEDGRFLLRKPEPTAEAGYTEEKITLDVSADSHGGGDLRLAEDFVRVVRGESPSLSYTGLDDSIVGHALVFAAESARKEQLWIDPSTI